MEDISSAAINGSPNRSTADTRSGTRTRACAAAKAVTSVVCAMMMGACSQGIMAPKGPIATAERLLLIDATVIMLLIVIPVILATILVAWWFRASNSRAAYRPEWSYSGRIELIVWLIPVLVVTFLGGIAWLSAHDLDPRKPLSSSLPPLDVQVVSLDWKWLFIYPELGVASINRLVVPAGRPVRFRLTSQSLMNSFFVPQLGSQIYTMAGMETRLNLLATRPGIFPGLSAQFSGDHFSDMRFTVLALDPHQYAQWRTTSRSAPHVLTRDVYRHLVDNRTPSPVIAFGRIDPTLFDAIVMQQSHTPSRVASPSRTTGP